MLHTGKSPNGLPSHFEAAVHIERMLAGCRHLAAAQGLRFLTYLIGMALEESRARTVAGNVLPAPLSDKEVCRYVDETVRQLLPLMQGPRLRTLAFMLDHVRSEAEAMMGECDPHETPPII